jgi:SAM-dependent methyltransferase
VADRVKVFCRDSVQDGFPGRFDLVIAFEVLPHIDDKQRLFEKVAAHLAPGGRILLADCVARTVTGVEVPGRAMFTSTTREYADVLAGARLSVDVCVDLSAEIAHFLDDPRFEENLAALAVTRPETRAFEEVHRGWQRFGQALEHGLFGYVLIELTHAPGEASRERIMVNNHQAFEDPLPYAITRAEIGRPEQPENRHFVDTLTERELDDLARELALSSEGGDGQEHDDGLG